MMLRTGWPPSALLLLGLLAAGALWLGIRALEAMTMPGLPASQMMQGAAPDTAILGAFDPFFRQPLQDRSELAVTALPLTLKGVRVDAASGRGAAFIAGADGVQRPYEPGEEVMEGVTLAAVAADHVILDRGGARETLWLDAAGAAGAAGEAVAAATPFPGAADLDLSPDLAEPPPPETPPSPDREEGA